MARPRAHLNGDLTVQDGRRRTRLAAEHLSQHAQLGYASTIASAQRLTVDSTVLVADSNLHREGLYVAVTRARTNMQLVVEADLDESDREVLETTLRGSSREASALVTNSRDLARSIAPFRGVVELRTDVRRALRATFGS